MDVNSSKPGCARCTTRLFTYIATPPADGFTLIELLVTMSIVFILAAYAVPSLSSLSNRQNQAAHINLLVSSLYLARSEAITRNSAVMVCKASDEVTCTNQGEWDQGWLVFEDRNNNRVLDEEEEVLTYQAKLSGVTIYYRAFGSTNYIVYNMRGVTNTNGTYTFCTSDGEHNARALIIAKTGRPRTSNTRSDGSPLTCPP